MKSADEYNFFKDFFTEYIKHTRGEFDKRKREILPNYNVICIHITSRQLSWGLKDWFKKQQDEKI